MVHLHIRDSQGNLTPDLTVFREIVERIREKSNIIIQASINISNAATAIVTGISVKPCIIIAKGGITSSKIGTKALKVKKAKVMGLF